MKATLCSCMKKKVIPSFPVCGEKPDDFDD